MVTDLSHRNPSFLALALSKEFLNFVSASPPAGPGPGLHSHLDVPSMCRPHWKVWVYILYRESSERGLRILSLKAFIALARCHYDDGLSAAHIAEAHRIA